MARPYKRELEYLESTGTQWIDTGIYLGATDNARYILTIRINAPRSGDYVPMGVLGNNCSIDYYRLYWSVAYKLGVGGSYTDATEVESNKWYTLELSNGACKIDGVEHLFTPVTNWSPLANRTIYLFAGNNTTPYGITPCSISSAKIYDGINILGDFIPVLDNNDVPCMYDRVSKQLFYNQGTGTFLYGGVSIIPAIPYGMNPFGGKRKLPYKRELEYLECTGTQYIDTRWSQSGVTATYSYQISYRYPDDNVQFSLWGCINRNPLVGYGNIYRHTTTLSSLWGGDNNANVQLNRTIATGIDYVDTVSVDIANNTVTRNGMSTTVSFSNGKGTDSAVLFAVRLLDTSIGQFAHIRCYYFKMYQDNALVQDFIPVLDNNNIPCMYDKVSKTFFYNQGTGQFSYGEKA